MARRRRATIDRNPISRIELWDRKMEPDVYARYLTAVKPLALRKFAEYQVVHEELIRMVKEVLAKYPEESAKQHAYMWFAQGVWYCKQHYNSKALEKEVNALFVYWYMLGLREEPMREICARLGISLPDWETILDPLAMPIYTSIKKALDELLTERRVYDILERTEYIPAFIEPLVKSIEISEKKEYLLVDTTQVVDVPIIHFMQVFIDATRSNVDLTFREYIKVHEETDFIPYFSQTLTLDELKEAVYILTRPSLYGLKLTVEPYSTPSSPFKIYYVAFISKVK